NRSSTHARSSGALGVADILLGKPLSTFPGYALAGGKRSHHPAPATDTVIMRTMTTAMMPQPTLVTAWPTGSMPDQITMPTSAAIPTSQAITPVCLTIPIPSSKSPGRASRRSPRNALLPRLFDVEGASSAEPDRELVGRAALRDQRRVGGVP